MLDRDVVEEFLDCKLKDLEIEIPEDISKEQLVETFVSMSRMITTSG
jgi:hypothetical protein